MAPSKFTSLKQKLHFHREKTDTTHMTGKNTDLPVSRSDHHEHSRAGFATSTMGAPLDHSQTQSDRIEPTTDHLIRQDSDGIHYNKPLPVIPPQQPQMMTQSYTSSQYDTMPTNYAPQTTSTFNPALNSESMVNSTSYTTVNSLNSSSMVNPTVISRSSIGETSVLPTVDVIENVEHVNMPAIVHEVITTQETVEVQPVIERQRETTDVEYVVKPLRTREVLPLEVRTGVLPPRMLPVIRETNYVENAEMIPIQIVQTVNVPVTQTVAVTTSRMMSLSEAAAYQSRTTMDMNGNGIPDSLERVPLQGYNQTTNYVQAAPSNLMEKDLSRNTVLSDRQMVDSGSMSY